LQDQIHLGQQVWGAAHARILWMRLIRARVAGSSGDPRTAADLSDRLAHECAQILGGSYLTLQARQVVARWTAAAGVRETAKQCYVALLADSAQVLGDDHWLASNAASNSPKSRRTPAIDWVTATWPRTSSVPRLVR
jgi:hypothetical protein